MALFTQMPFNFFTRKRLPFCVFGVRKCEKRLFTRARQQKVTVGRVDANCVAHMVFRTFYKVLGFLCNLLLR